MVVPYEIMTIAEPSLCFTKAACIDIHWRVDALSHHINIHSIVTYADFLEASGNKTKTQTRELYLLVL